MATVSELLEYEIYPQLDRVLVFEELEPKNKGQYLLCKCPECKQRSAYIYHNGIFLICNRLNKCSFRISIWDYVQKQKNLSNQETLYKLARLAGVSIPKNESEEEYEIYNAEERKAYILETLMQWASDNLLNNKIALEYLQKRGFSKQEDIQQAGLGFIPSLNEMTVVLRKADIAEEELKKLGLLSKKWESHPLIGLWRNRAGQPWTIWGRCFGSVPEGEQKYYLLPGEGTKATPYMLHQVSGKELVIVEGFLDALVLQLFGEKRAVAIIGVFITQDQLKTLQRLHIKRVLICLDPDRAGEQGLVKNIDNLAKIGIQSYVVPDLPDRMDPDEFILRSGIEAWQYLLSKAKKGVIWKTQNLFCKVNLTLDIEKDKAIEEFLKFVSQISSPVETEEALQTATTYLNLSAGSLSCLLYEIRTRQGQEDLKQKVRGVLRQGQEQVENEGIVVTQVVEKLQNDFVALKVSQSYALPSSLDVTKLRVAAAVFPEGKKTGYKLLDETVVITSSELTIVGARPRHGKTSFACNLFLNWAQLYKNDPFILFSYEVNSVQLFAKLISLITGRQENQLRTSGYSFREILHYLRTGMLKPNADIEKAIEILQTYEHQLFVITEPTTTIEQLVAYSKSVREKWGRLGAILVDYIELVKVPEEKSEELRIASIVNQLRIASQILETPVIALAQMNRSTVTGGGKQIKRIDGRRPVLEGLRYSGRQEQEASNVLGLFNRYIESSDVCSEEEQAKIEGTITAAPLEVIVHKNRYGESNKIINMVFNMFTGHIEEERELPRDIL